MTPTPPDMKSIFGRALEIESAAGRAAYLDEACGPMLDSAPRSRACSRPLAAPASSCSGRRQRSWRE